MKIYDTQKQKIKEANFNVTTFNLKKAKVHSILKDKIGNIWLGFFQKGVMIIPATTNKFKPNKLHCDRYRTQNLCQQK